MTGTEVLTGIISDRNGPWVSVALRELGVDAAMIEIVGDRPEDLFDALVRMREAGLSLIVTSGGLGPTADDLTADVVGRFCQREMVLDEPLADRIADIVRPMMSRWPNADPEAMLEANRKQAIVPAGATVLEPVGTAPGLVVPYAGSGGGPTVVVLPGPPRELHPMWEAAVATEPFTAAIAGATEYRREIVRMYGLPEAELAATLRDAEAAGVALSELEVTTCLRRGEIEIATRYEPDAQASYQAMVDFVRERHGRMLFSEDGSTIDDQVAALLSRDGEGGGTLAVAESCTAGLLAARLTERPGASAYFLGGGVVYSNSAKTLVAGVPPELIASVGAVSVEVAEALASGIASAFGADYGVGITGIAGPDGGTEDKPVGLVCISVYSARDGRHMTRSPRMPGSRADVRDRSVTVALHLLRRLLLGGADAPRGDSGSGTGPGSSAPSGADPLAA